MSPYEVWCHHCNVTFPPEQKRCLHCGARTRDDSPRRGGTRTGSHQTVLTAEPVVFHDTSGPVSAVPELEASSASAEAPEEAAPGRGSLLRAGMTVLWMVLLAAGYAWRACSQ